MPLLPMLTAAALASATVTVPGPSGPLEGTFVDAGKGAPVVVIIPGSGPTDRDGNNPLGVTSSTYRLLAEALAARGVSSIRIDKRGMFGSKAAIPDANKVTIAGYAADARAWAAKARSLTGAKCAWLVGHSEGVLVALAAGQQAKDLCGVVAVSGMGRKFGAVLREQLAANPANAPLLAPADSALKELEAGRKVDVATLPAPIAPLFAPQIQDYVIDLLRQDSAGLAASLKLPLLIVHGDKDIQASNADARALAAAQPKARLVIVPGVNHVLKAVKGDDRAANLAAYADPSLPVAPAVVDEIAGFVKTKS
ncbi:alpha/beta hydrolase [Sphingomonas mesophila]|uniref:alpha/beta hydrolase n=1 Tax=Sphingomonas mesophila TaxID=2303576 RepID=UPI0019682EFB|nr:alpha/beta hydrolase [Sphingomonas mesophila]